MKSKIHNAKAFLYRLLILPKTTDEDVMRREAIFNILVLSLLMLTVAATSYMIFNRIVKGAVGYEGLPVYTLLPPVVVLILFYIISRLHFRNLLVYAFIALYLALGTFALLDYGYALPEGLLAYVLVIVISGILISNRAAVITIIIVMLCLGAIAYLQNSGHSHPDSDDLVAPIIPGHSLIYLMFFLVIFSVSWLSTRDIEKSLNRARISEDALREERNLLEVKVKQRTQELERVEIEKFIELQRFAEFGRLSSTLVHDLVNPLNTVTIELDQLINDKRHASSVSELQKSIASMEQYITTARLRLRNQKVIRIFNVSDEIKNACSLLVIKLKQADVIATYELDRQLKLKGDIASFKQFITNLISNAIDAYDSGNFSRREIIVHTARKNESIIITIKDFGRGMDINEVSHAFDAFYTTKSSNKGTGLGLAIVKRTVEEDFSGAIVLESIIGTGSHFIITMPMNPLLNKTKI